MNDVVTRAVPPFAFWPDRASAIRGLGGAKHFRKRDYAFHTIYVEARPGPAGFSGRFAGLAADGGLLQLRVRALPIGRENATIIARDQVAFAALIANGGGWRIGFEALPGVLYAVEGVVEGGADAAADGLDIEFDGWGDGSGYTAALAQAREAVFVAPSEVERRWWRRTSPVERAGLISGEPATLAAPVSQMCTAGQMEEPTYARWLAELRQPFAWHRKQWEFVYILSVLEVQGMLQPGRRGLGFGCGAEFLPALFAAKGCTVVASDMAAETQAASGWVSTNQHAGSLEELQRPDICPPETFLAHASFREVDMNAIPPDLADFDFCWSACAYEHLGSIEAGLRFVRNSVACLRPGGVAVHTSELNLSSNEATIDNLETVLFRRRDMERLALDLTRAGHRVLPLKYDQGDQPPDLHVDVPPYTGSEHLKLALGQFVSTSFGFVVIRGGGRAQGSNNEASP